MIALDHWRLATDADGNTSWDLPAGATHALDLRRVPDMSQTAAAHRSLFWFPVAVPRTARPLGNALDAPLSVADRDALAQAAGVTRWTSQPDTILRAVLMIFGDRCSLDPAATPRPLVPTTSRDMILHLGPHTHRERFEWGKHPQTDLLRAVQRDQFAAKWSTVNSEQEAAQVRRELDYINCKFPGSDWREFIATGIRAELQSPLAHATSVGDTFERADNTDLNASHDGKTLNGSPATWSWTEVVENTGIAAGRLVGLGTQSANHAARIESDLSGSDHENEVIVTVLAANTARGCAPLIRFAAAATTYYGAVLRFGGLFRLLKSITGTITNLTAGVSATIALPETIKCRCSGSTLSSYRAAALVESITDTSIAANTRVGAGLLTPGSASSSIGQLAAADLSVNSPWIYYAQQRRNR